MQPRAEERGAPPGVFAAERPALTPRTLELAARGADSTSGTPKGMPISAPQPRAEGAVRRLRGSAPTEHAYSRAHVIARAASG